MTRRRAVNVLGAEAVFERRPDGTTYVRSPRPLGNYPSKLTERLEHWAAVAPDRTFLAQRDGSWNWRQFTYREALRQVRSIAQSLLNRRLSPDRPIMILSGNSIEHALLALAAMYSGVPHAPVAPYYSLASQDGTTLRYVWQRLDPAIVFAADGALFERPLAGLLDERTELVTVTPPSGLNATPFNELLESGDSQVDNAHARVTPDTIAKVLFTSGSTASRKA